MAEIIADILFRITALVGGISLIYYGFRLRELWPLALGTALGFGGALFLLIGR